MVIDSDKYGEFRLKEEFLAPHQNRPVRWGFGSFYRVTYKCTYTAAAARGVGDRSARYQRNGHGRAARRAPEWDPVPAVAASDRLYSSL
jgi:hypothetical protein